eukprot:TRINITY_DN8693_c0_g1_i1.p1 TRINITY_DN8693_c0_g1~~TRINITY_DN8693_c0_g1_i1.p1  ORF type:complete len:485 (+),score=99.83 TRINITY_DN8693_c0_g1_i1:1180-2634(+)
MVAKKEMQSGLPKETFSTVSFFQPMETHQFIPTTSSSVGSLITNGASMYNRFPISSLKLSSTCHGMEPLDHSLEHKREMPKGVSSTMDVQFVKTNKPKICKGLREKGATTSVESSQALESKQHSIVEQHVMHKFGVLKSHHITDESHREDMIRKTILTATNNLPMKGLKYVPLLQSPFEGHTHCQESVRQECSQIPSLENMSEHFQKRKLDYLLNPNLQHSDHSSSEAMPTKGFKKPNISSGALETFGTDMSLQQRDALQEQGNLAPKVITFDLHGRNALGQSLHTNDSSSKSSVHSGLQDDSSLASQKMSRNDYPTQQSVITAAGLSIESSNSKRDSLELSFRANGSAKPKTVKDGHLKLSSSPSDWGKFLALSASSEMNKQGDEPERDSPAHYELRQRRLQAFLKHCDDTAQGYSQCLWSLSAADRSALAVKLEQRAIMLSLEEVKEFSRLNTLGIFGKSLSSSTKDTAGGTTQKLLVPNPS